jgi:hypothetical protein
MHVIAAAGAAINGTFTLTFRLDVWSHKSNAISPMIYNRKFKIKYSAGSVRVFLSSSLHRMTGGDGSFRPEPLLMKL